MKYLAIIIANYFLLLAVLPCHCDLHIDSTEYKVEQISDAHTQNKLNQEACTPFCACAGFHNPNFIAKNEFDVLALTSLLSPIAIYNDGILPSCQNSLWRPPQA